MLVHLPQNFEVLVTERVPVGFGVDLPMSDWPWIFTPRASFGSRFTPFTLRRESLSAAKHLSAEVPFHFVATEEITQTDLDILAAEYGQAEEMPEADREAEEELIENEEETDKEKEEEAYSIAPAKPTRRSGPARKAPGPYEKKTWALGKCFGCDRYHAGAFCPLSRKERAAMRRSMLSQRAEDRRRSLEAEKAWLATAMEERKQRHAREQRSHREEQWSYKEEKEESKRKQRSYEQDLYKDRQEGEGEQGEAVELQGFHEGGGEREGEGEQEPWQQARA